MGERNGLAWRLFLFPTAGTPPADARKDFYWPETCGARKKGDYCPRLWAAPLGSVNVKCRREMEGGYTRIMKRRVA